MISFRFLDAVAWISIISLFPLIAVWWRAGQTPLARKLMFSAALVATNTALLLSINYMISMGYGREHFGVNLEAYSHRLETETPDDAITSTRLLKGNPMLLYVINRRDEK